MQLKKPKKNQEKIYLFSTSTINHIDILYIYDSEKLINNSFSKMIKNALICLKINSNDLFMLKVQEKYTYMYIHQ